MAGIDFVVLIGYGSLMMFISQLIDILQYIQLQNAEINWYRNWRRETNRQRTEQLWREMWRQSDEEDFQSYVDFFGEFEELTWSVNELFKEYCEGWSFINEEFGNMTIFEFEEEEIWDI